jgi:hypothetical protein
MTTETSTQQRQSWWRAAPLPEANDGGTFSHDAMVGHFAAMYIAHIEAYHQAVKVQSRKIDAGYEGGRDAIGVALRAAIVEHLYPAKAAWSCAALLMGKSAEDVWGCYDDPQVADELAWEWLVKATGMTGEQIRALTTVPVKGEDGLY